MHLVRHDNILELFRIHVVKLQIHILSDSFVV